MFDRLGIEKEDYLITDSFENTYVILVFYLNVSGSIRVFCKDFHVSVRCAWLSISHRWPCSMALFCMGVCMTWSASNF